MSYIYESHMGGLYTTEEAQDWDDLYCEQCGDSDWEKGRADTLEEAWDMLKDETSGCSVCDTCEKYKEAEANDDDPDADDYACCINCGREDAQWGSWEFSYIMSFLEENFETEQPIYVYLIATNNINDKIFVNCQPKGYKYGEIYQLPKMFCASEEFIHVAAESLCRKLENPDMNTLRPIDDTYHNGVHEYIFEVVDRLQAEDEGTHWEEDGWYGWFSPDCIKDKEEKE